jgi:ABC-type nitrate/sulfonate/bicarbonate transport system substrate-binding protein
MRRIFLTTLVLSAIACGWISASFAADTIRIAYSSINPHALLVSLAEKRGLFAKYGLSSVVVYYPAAAQSYKRWFRVMSIWDSSPARPGVAANLRGADILYIAMTDDRMGYQLATRQDIKNPAELKGKRLGISRFASSADLGLARS